MRIQSRPLKTIFLLGAAFTATAALGACTTTGGAMGAAAFSGPVAGPESPTSAPQTLAMSDTDARASDGSDFGPVPATGARTLRYAVGGPAALPASSFMVLGQAALPPIGFMEFCTRYPAQCGRADAAPTSLRKGRADRYYWAAAFSGGPAATSRAPTSASAAGASEPVSPSWTFGPRARFDWSLVFQPTASSSAGGVGPVRSAATPAPVMTAQLWTVLDEVNRGVNGAIREESDQASSGVSDHWDLPLADGRRVGDCEDFALEKRRALIARGLHEADLSLALVITHWGESHAVLIVRTTAGDYVLDSLTPNVMPWRALDYRWVERQSPGDPTRWVRIG
jgi:predicted transglutaminase-like cysteine proteinase